MSKFNTDLTAERILSQYLDEMYREYGWTINRVSDKKRQNRGIDFILEYKSRKFKVDEKSQLHYLNKSLPTFAFELSYLKGVDLKKGWLFDDKKDTDYYFLSTSIFLKNDKKTLVNKSDIASLKLTSINRSKLIALLKQRGITDKSIELDIYDIRQNEAYGRHELIGLDLDTEGYLYFSGNYSEKPINLVLKLDFLFNSKVAKFISP